MDLTATVTAKVNGISFRSLNTIYLKIRHRLAEACEQASPLNGSVEVDESYFGAYRVPGRRGPGAYGMTILFALFERRGMVYTVIMPDCTNATLQGIIRGRIDPASVIHLDGWLGYDGLVDISFDKHF